MKLYRPVLIETAEQAEALPGKAVILVALKRTGEVHASHLHGDLTPDYWPNRLEEPRRWDWTALVPVEAEEEVMPASRIAGRLTESGVEFTPDTGKVATWQRRYVTPWTEDTPAHPQETFTVPWETSGPSPHRRGGCA